MSRRGDNIHKRKDGRWEGRYKYGTKNNGFPAYRSVYGKTYTECKKKLEEMKNEKNLLPKTRYRELKFSEILFMWLNSNRIRIKGATENKYSWMIEKHILPELGNKKVAELTSTAINLFLDKKIREGSINSSTGLSPSYVKTIAIIIESALNFAIAEGLCEHIQLTINKPIVPKPEINILPMETQQILENILVNDSTKVALGTLIALYTGLRIGEICALRWNDIDFDEDLIFVRHTITRVKSSDYNNKTKLIMDTPKTATSKRVIPILSILKPRLKNSYENRISDFVVSDNIQGNSLNKALDEYGALPQDQVIQWAKQLCDVIGYLHTRNPAIIYRDMKPANVMLKPDGNVTLIDFGTAREFKEKNLADTTCLGTVGYAAPEQFGGMGQTDARTDIYCLGATLYHLVTGMNPCEPPYEIKPIRQINPTLSSGLEKIILKCTQRDPNDRYQSAAELMYALEHYDEIDDIYRKKQKKKLGAFIATSALTLIFAATSIFGFISAENKKKENYDYAIKSISSITDFDAAINKYYEAIALDPTRTEAYLGTESGDKGLIEFLIDDGVLESSEAGYLQQLRSGINQENIRGYDSSVDAIDELRKVNQEGYQDVCYEIGQAYLFYYEVNVSKDKYERASNWFQYAKTKYKDAQIYCDIAECVTNIAKYGATEQYSSASAEYEVLWNQLKTLNSNADNFDTDLKVRVWNEIINMLNEYTEQFSSVVSNSEILGLIYSVEDNCAEVADNVFVKESLDELQSNIETLRSRLDTIADKYN